MTNQGDGPLERNGDEEVVVDGGTISGDTTLGGFEDEPLEVVVEPDVQPKGTVDLKSLGTGPASDDAPAPEHDAGDEPDTAMLVEAAVAEPMPARPAAAGTPSDGTPIPSPSAVDAPRPLAPLGPPEPELALVDGGLGAGWEVTRLIVWLLVCTLAVGGLALWLGDLWPWGGATPAVATVPETADGPARVPVAPEREPEPLSVGGDAPAEETTPEVAAPEETTPEVATPEETTPEVAAPEETAPEEAAPEETTPEETTPEETTPEETTPEEATPEETTPEEATPEETTPEEATPEETTPEETTPEEAAPEEATPGETTPEEATPEEAAPEEAAPEETTPEEATPEEAAPEETVAREPSKLHPLEDDPAKLDALRALGAEQFAQEQYEAAAETLAQLVEAVPEDGEARFLRARALERLDRDDDAMEEYTQAAAAAPEDPRPLNNLALIHLRRGEQQTAREALDKALAIAPEDPNVLTNMANVMVEEAPEQAHPLYEKVLSASPDHAPARLGRALARERLGDLAGASADYEALTSADDPAHRAAAKAGLGRIAHRQGRPGEAVPLLREALTLVDDPNTRISLGAALLAAGDADGARRVLADALRARPNDALAWRTIAVALTRLGRDRPHLLDKAKDAYRQAIRIDPTHWQAFYNYALLAEELRSFPVAIQLYERAIKVDARAWRAHANLARLYGDAGRWDRALGILDDALAASPDVPDLHLQRAYVLGKLDRGMDARAALRRYTILAAPDDPRLKTIEERLEGHDPGS